MKKYYCDVCGKDVTEIRDRNKIKITECWDGSTYRKLLCDECLHNIFALLNAKFAQKAPE